jgi:hypothetical protein
MRQAVKLAVVIAVALASVRVACAQSASGTVNATLINKSGIALIFHSSTSGVPLTGNGSSNATLPFGTVSAFGTLATAGVTRPSVTSTNYTIRSYFNTYVSNGGFTAYTMTASLSAVTPGITYYIDTTPLSTTSQTIMNLQTTFDQDVQHNLDLMISTANSGSGGPTTNSVISATINFTVTGF